MNEINKEFEEELNNLLDYKTTSIEVNKKIVICEDRGATTLDLAIKLLEELSKYRKKNKFSFNLKYTYTYGYEQITSYGDFIINIYNLKDCLYTLSNMIAKRFKEI